MVFLKWISSAKKAALLILFLFTSAAVQSQTLQNTVVPNITGPGQNVFQATEGTLHIVAAMVEFQPDTTRFTSGDGTFTEVGIPYLENENIAIDPLPHNKQYFEAHLEFARNYYSKMSSGVLNIQYHVLDPVFRLPEKMGAYSPVGFDPSSEPLAEFARDAWEEIAAAGNLDLNLNPADNIAFVLFHAGVGRDIELTGTILEKTPQDIPSVYLSRDSFRRLFDDPSFSGFGIDNGNLLVDNTLILPRTLTRVGEDVTGAEVLLQLSTNGMVTAQIGSHIGLTDLFNTETGESGIGSFGLMDGAGIFSYNGLFPPELSAWEKIRMGWAETFEPSLDQDADIELPASSLRQQNSIAKIPLSSSEYFLVENRHREADHEGTTLTIRKPGGQTVTQTFFNSDTSFVFQESGFTDRLEPGVVTDVSNYDFALPGGISEFLEETTENEDEERILNGGILIWHIDEGIIENRLNAGVGINSNPDRRGVRLVEADGAQDIGRPTAIGLFQNEVNGSAFDFWWSGNDASVITQTGTITLYQNRFGPDTTPNNDSNSGATSGFELVDFSDNQPIASLTLREAATGGDLFEVEEFVQDLPFRFFTPQDHPYWSNYPLSTFSTGNSPESILPAADGILFRNDQRDMQMISSSEISSYQQPVYFPGMNFIPLASNPAETESVISVNILEQTSSGFSEFWTFETEANNGLISSPGSDILQFDGTPARAIINPQTFEGNFYSTGSYRSESIRGYESSISSDGEIVITTPEKTFTTEGPALGEIYQLTHIGLVEQEDGRFRTFLLLNNLLVLFEPGPDGLENRLIHSTEQIDWPALADIDRSGSVDFIFIDRSENHVVAKNQNGAVLSGFPIQAPTNIKFTGTPLITDLDGDDEFEMLITGQDQQSINLYGYGPDGKPLEEFPLLVGGISNQDDDPVHPSIGGEYLTAVSHDGDLRVWRFPNMGKILWGSKYGNDGNNKLTGRQLTGRVEAADFGILNKSETYNWPNPARDETFIRFQTAEPGEVKIRITTTSGRLIYDRTLQSRGGSPEEISIDTSGWGSGGYIAVVTANVNGDSDRKLIKIAIAK